MGFVRDHDAIFSRQLCVLCMRRQLLLRVWSVDCSCAIHSRYSCLRRIIRCGVSPIIIEAKGILPSNRRNVVISPDHVRQYISPEDPATLEGVYIFVPKDYSEEVWQTLQNIAVRMSDDRLKNMKAE